MEVSVWRFGVSVSGYGQGTSRARPLKGTLLWPNGQIDIPAVLQIQKVYKDYFGCWVQWMYLFGDFSSMWLGLARARLLKGAIMTQRANEKNWKKNFWKNFNFFFFNFFQKCWQFEKIANVLLEKCRETELCWRKFVSERTYPEGRRISQWSNWHSSNLLSFPHDAYVGCFVQWKCLIFDSTCLCLIIACARLLNISILRPCGQKRPRLVGCWIQWKYIWRLGTSLVGCGVGTSPEWRPIMTQWANEKK